MQDALPGCNISNPSVGSDGSRLPAYRNLLMDTAHPSLLRSMQVLWDRKFKVILLAGGWQISCLFPQGRRWGGLSILKQLGEDWVLAHWWCDRWCFVSLRSFLFMFINPIKWILSFQCFRSVTSVYSFQCWLIKKKWSGCQGEERNKMILSLAEMLREIYESRIHLLDLRVWNCLNAKFSVQCFCN